MADKPTPFVVNDRRKFTADGELRHDADPQPNEIVSTPAINVEADPSRRESDTIPFPSTAASPFPSNDEPVGTLPEPLAFPNSDSAPEDLTESGDDRLPPGPTAEQSEQAARAYNATVERLDTAIRATNPGAERIPEMSFEQFVQSLYMQAILQLGGGAEPGQQPQVDIIGARQTIDMIAILAETTRGNLKPMEDKLLQSALFEARMGFLEVTQAIARQAAGRQPGSVVGPAGGPSIVR